MLINKILKNQILKLIKSQIGPGINNIKIRKIENKLRAVERKLAKIEKLVNKETNV